MKKKKEERYVDPSWIRMPTPPEYRTKYLGREEVIRRLKRGEELTYSSGHVGRSSRFYSFCHFKRDSYLKSVHRSTLASLQKNGQIILTKGDPTKVSPYLIYKWNKDQMK